MGKYWTRLLLVLSRFFAPLSLLVYITYFFFIINAFYYRITREEKIQKVRAHIYYCNDKYIVFDEIKDIAFI